MSLSNRLHNTCAVSNHVGRQKPEESVGWFSKKSPYRELVLGALKEAMATDLKSETPFDGYYVNNLEAVIAIFWMVERSLRPLSRAKLEQAGMCLMEALLDWFSSEYSSTEIRSLVIPAFDKRLNEYSTLFTVKADEKPTAPMMRTFGRIISNVFGGEQTDIAQISAAILLWWKPISVEGARIVQLDRKGLVSWKD